MIDAYTFGKMVVDGTEYEKDLMILSDGSVVHPWWRETGHNLTKADLERMLENPPKVIVAGTGSPGMMKVDHELVEKLKSDGIEIIVLPTEQAVERYNKLVDKGGNAAACFHLTC